MVGEAPAVQRFGGDRPDHGRALSGASEGEEMQKEDGNFGSDCNGRGCLLGEGARRLDCCVVAFFSCSSPNFILVSETASSLPRGLAFSWTWYHAVLSSRQPLACPVVSLSLGHDVVLFCHLLCLINRRCSIVLRLE